MFNEPDTAFAIAGDWHENLMYALDCIDYVARSGTNTIIHLGDFGYSYSDSFLDGVQAQLELRNMHLYFIDGNHEDFNYLDSLEIDSVTGLCIVRDNLFYLPRGHRWTWNGVSFMALGGAVSADQDRRVPGVSWWHQEEISPYFVDDMDKSPVDVMFTHDCPDGVEIPDIRDNERFFDKKILVKAQIHRERLRDIVDHVRPKKLFHGHYHTAYTSELQGLAYRTQVHGLDCDKSRLQANCAFYVFEPNYAEIESWT